MKAYVLIKIRTGEIPEAMTQLLEAKSVLMADMTFGPYDAMAVVGAKDLNVLGRVVAHDIQPIVGVTETLTCPVIEGM